LQHIFVLIAVHIGANTASVITCKTQTLRTELGPEANGPLITLFLNFQF